MSLKKGVIENYFKGRELQKIDIAANQVDEIHKYSRNRVFDEPESLKKFTLAVPLGECDEELFFKNQKQSEDKVETNLRQIEDKHKTNLGQSKDKVKTNLGHIKEKLETELRTQPKTNIGQTKDKLETTRSIQKSFFSLVGLQRKILLFVHNQCKLNRDKVTFPLSIEIIATHCNTTLSSARKTLQRLEKQNYIIRKEFKNGRGGWTRYELPQDAFQELLHYENYDQNKSNLETNLRQSEDKLESQLRTQLKTPLSSSSSYNITTTELPDEWKKINFSELEQIGFTQGHLVQLYRCGNFDPTIVQESIEFFAFDLISNHKAKEIKTNPLAYFMGILKRTGLYTAPENYESVKDKAIRLYLQKQKALKEKRALLEKELMQTAYEEWINRLSEEEKSKLLPEPIKNDRFQAPKTAALKSYYEKHIWHTKKDELLKSIMST